MSAQPTSQTMKPATAAKKLGIHLEATPSEFRANPVSRADLERLRSDPPEWFVALRRDGPHPRPVVADRLGVTNSGLARGGITEALTTAEIDALLAEPPDWLVAERANLVEVRNEAKRVRVQRVAKGERSNRRERSARPRL